MSERAGKVRESFANWHQLDVGDGPPFGKAAAWPPRDRPMYYPAITACSDKRAFGSATFLDHRPRAGKPGWLRCLSSGYAPRKPLELPVKAWPKHLRAAANRSGSRRSCVVCKWHRWLGDVRLRRRLQLQTAGGMGACGCLLMQPDDITK
jgi:hypothetical protein